MALGRLYYVVAPDSAGDWQVSTHDGAAWTAPVSYSTRPDAIAGAVRLARAENYASQRPTGVRVRLAPGNWATSHTFGRETPALLNPAA